MNRLLGRIDSAYNRITGSFFSGFPKSMKTVLLSTFIIGLIAHGYCYTNSLFLHDGSWVYSSIDGEWWGGATGGRFLAMPLLTLTGLIQLPWLEGFFVLLEYSLSAWLVCQVLQIKSAFWTIAISGIMVTSPTLISSNFYLSSGHVYALALLAACFSVYAAEKWRYGLIPAFIALFVCCASYPAYISAAVSLFIIANLIKALAGQVENQKKFFVHQLAFAMVSAASLLLNYLICMALPRTTDAGVRILKVNEGGIASLLEGIKDAYQWTEAFFLPGGVHTGIDYSFFNDQYTPVQFRFFWILIILSFFMIIFQTYNHKVWKKPVALFSILAELLLLPLAMNIIGIFEISHLLMTFSFITPWLFFASMAELGQKEQSSGEASVKKRCYLLYGWATVILTVATIYNGCILANQAYSKAYVVYNSALSLSERIADRIEGTEEYIPGETPVYIVGDLRDYYAPYRPAYAILDSVTGIGGPWWDTAIVGGDTLQNYLTQQLGLSINFVCTPLINYEFLSGQPMTAMSYAEGLIGSEYKFDVSEFVNKYSTTPAFPSRNCTFWCGEILVVKLSE